MFKSKKESLKSPVKEGKKNRSRSLRNGTETLGFALPAGHLAGAAATVLHRWRRQPAPALDGGLLDGSDSVGTDLAPADAQALRGLLLRVAAWELELLQIGVRDAA